MSTPGSPYYDQLRLLVQLLSHVRQEECFALKGGTAINLLINGNATTAAELKR